MIYMQLIDFGLATVGKPGGKVRICVYDVHILASGGEHAHMCIQHAHNCIQRMLHITICMQVGCRPAATLQCTSTYLCGRTSVAVAPAPRRTWLRSYLVDSRTIVWYVYIYMYTYTYQSHQG